jgi:lysophospholipase L1-like esterase
MRRDRMGGVRRGRWGVKGAGVLLLVVTAAAVAQSTRPTPDPERFANDIAAFEAWDRKNSAAADAVLFVGSSSIRMWDTHSSFPELPVINRGFGGSHISDVNYFARRIVLPYEPRVIVFYAGDNDVAAGKSAERVRADFRSFVALVHAALPEVRVVYLPIKPSVARWSHWPRMRSANELVRAVCEADARLTYVDVATPLLADDGQPRADLLLEDGLHLNAAGYALWTRTLRPVLTGLMGEEKGAAEADEARSE